MSEDLKEKLCIQLIRDYKNKDFTDEEIKERYGLALEYMLQNDVFDKLVSIGQNGNVSSMTQGSRSVSYKEDIGSLISADMVLVGLLGRPFMRCY